MEFIGDDKNYKLKTLATKAIIARIHENNITRSKQNKRQNKIDDYAQCTYSAGKASFNMGSGGETLTPGKCEAMILAVSLARAMSDT